MQFCVAMTALLLLLLPQRSPRACTPSVGLHSPFSAQRALSAVVVPEPACGASCKKHQVHMSERLEILMTKPRCIMLLRGNAIPAPRALEERIEADSYDLCAKQCGVQMVWVAVQNSAQ
jgi:hypothetical protein